VYAALASYTVGAGLVTVVGSTLLLLLEVAALALSVSYAFEIADVLGRRGPNPPAPPAHQPWIAIQVPAYNEPIEVVSRTLRALSRLRYERLLIQVVDNNTKDPAVWKPLEALCRELGPRFEFIHLEDWPGFKAGALNEATRRLPEKFEVVGIVDADYEVDPSWLEATAGHFEDPAVAFVQTPQEYRDWEDDPYLRGLYFSYRYFFVITMPARAHRNAIIFAGTMGLLRRSALEEIGGWNPDVVTEDAEASLRMLGRGLRGVYEPRAFGRGMMPLTFDGLKKQRFRWALGGVQILRLHWRELMPFGAHRLRLTAAQRINYLLGSVQWFGDVLMTAFTVILMLTALGIAVNHRLPVRQLTGAAIAVPAVFLLTGLMRALVALRATTGASWGDALRALRVWFALSWVVTLACVRGLVRAQAAFLRTPKRAEGEGGVLRALQAARAETLLVAGSVAGAVALLIHDFAWTTVALAVLLLFQGWVYANAAWAALASEGIKLTPERRAYLRSPQSSGDWPAGGGSQRLAVGLGVAAVAGLLLYPLTMSGPPAQPFTSPGGPEIHQVRPPGAGSGGGPPVQTPGRGGGAKPSPSPSPTSSARPVAPSGSPNG
jgi:cellulose synthase/poly-beta-1,6-N-acetylglucosamine synthase-like glycosyltransferase